MPPLAVPSVRVTVAADGGGREFDTEVDPGVVVAGRQRAEVAGCEVEGFGGVDVADDRDMKIVDLAEPTEKHREQLGGVERIDLLLRVEFRVASIAAVEKGEQQLLGPEVGVGLGDLEVGLGAPVTERRATSSTRGSVIVRWIRANRSSASLRAAEPLIVSFHSSMPALEADAAALEVALQRRRSVRAHAAEEHRVDRRARQGGVGLVERAPAAGRLERDEEVALGDLDS